MNIYPKAATSTDAVEIVVAMIMGIHYLIEHLSDATSEGLLEVLRAYTRSEIKAMAAAALLSSKLEVTA